MVRLKGHIEETQQGISDLLTDFARAVSFDNLYDSFMEVSEGKWENKEFVYYYMNLEENLIDLQNRLVYGLWRPHNTVEFYIREPKLRHISRPVIEDRIVHHAVFRIIEKSLEEYLSFAAYSCRKGRGTVSACERLQKLYRSAIGKWGFDFYVIKGDFKKFFESINIEVLKMMLMRIIKDGMLLALIFLILDNFEGAGLAIGFLLSQGFSNLVGAILDYYVTDILGIGKYYIRYADDFRIIVPTRKKALEVLYSIDELICGKMHQSLSAKKTKIVKYSGKDTFCGYVICPHHFEAKTSAVKRHERRITHKAGLYDKGVITLTQFADTVHSAVDYLIKTDARSEKIENAVLMLYNQGISTKDFRKLVTGRGLK